MNHIASSAPVVATALKTLGHTSKWLAEELKMPHTSVWRKTNGGLYEFKLPELFEVAQVLGVRPLSLLPASFLAGLSCDTCGCTLNAPEILSPAEPQVHKAS